MFNKNQVVAVVMGGPSAEREVSLIPVQPLPMR